MQIITGFHAIEEMLRTGAGTTTGAKARLLYNKPGPRVKKILEDAKRRGIPSSETTATELDSLTAHLSETARSHRGLVLTIDGGEKPARNIVQFETALAEIACKKDAVVVLLDSVTDPHNVGAILRSCDQFGAALVVMPEHRSAVDSDVIARTSAGAYSWVPVAVVANLSRAVEQLKETGFWVYGADADGDPAHEAELAGKTALILGSEGNGIGRLLREKCDKILSIPTCGKLDSLNVSVAAGILLYEIHRQHLIAQPD